MTDETYLIKTSPQFDVHKWSEYPEVNHVVDALFEEIKTLRTDKGIRIRGADKVKRSIKVIIMDLWVAYKLTPNPYRGISKNKTDFGKDTRYKKIFLKFNYFVGVVNDLAELLYIQEELGQQGAYRTRIKANEKLIEKILSPEYGVGELVASNGNMALVQYNQDLERETILLHDENKKNIGYEDTLATNTMRENLKKINAKLASSRIILDITNEQHGELLAKLNAKKEEDNPRLDFTNNRLHRVFNQSSFEKGGRFYGPWWQNIPKEYRKFIDIGYKPTIELDYSGHHLRILYALEDLDPPESPYDIEGFEYEDQKLAALIMLNVSKETSALQAMNSKGLKRGQALIDALKERHSQIAHKFFTGVGLELMYLDSMLAEKVMLRMLDRGATVLPVHDSFIVRNSYADELEEIMKEEFLSTFGRRAELKIKKTAGEERRERGTTETEVEVKPIDIFTMLEEMKEYSWRIGVWGY